MSGLARPPPRPPPLLWRRRPALSRRLVSAARRTAATTSTSSSSAAATTATTTASSSLSAAGPSQLHRQMLRLVELTQPTARQAKERELAAWWTAKAVREAAPGATVHIFGSTATGCQLPGSDLDLVAIRAPSRRKKGVAPESAAELAPHSRAFEQLRKIQRRVRASGVADQRDPLVVIRAKAPLPPASPSRLRRDGERVSSPVAAATGASPPLQREAVSALGAAPPPPCTQGTSSSTLPSRE